MADQTTNRSLSNLSNEFSNRFLERATVQASVGQAQLHQDAVPTVDEDQRKAAGHRSLAAYAVGAFVATQYKIIKIKFAISIIDVTPATASTNASVASW